MVRCPARFIRKKLNQVANWRDIVSPSDQGRMSWRTPTKITPFVNAVENRCSLTRGQKDLVEPAACDVDQANLRRRAHRPESSDRGIKKEDVLH